METHIDFAAIQQLLTRAEEAGRKYLFEYEVYDLIRHSGSETPPAYFILRKNRRLKREDLDTLPGEKVVVKVISAYILHKSDVGGVRVVAKTVGEILSAVRSMYYDIAAAYRQAAGDG
ncbi:MAG TPA: acetate--CoA ligase family protein, partial [Desulfopila sp.]|nr:acetate--CoA ligase family protein [Desulfopila sp.]